MKLINTHYNLEINLLENKIMVLAVENPVAYAELIGDIWRQVNGEEGNFILSDGVKSKNMSKEMECILNPFALNCNSKKVITRLYQELKEQANDMLQEETININCSIINYLEKVIMTVPYNIKLDYDMDISGILKLYGVEIEKQADILVERIIEYIRVVSKICGVKIFVFVDIKHYLSESELKSLYEVVFYEKINIVIIEPVYTERLDGEKGCIIDKDLCIIDL